jgi:hypothetical protein
MTWAEVQKIHTSQRGILVKGGRVVSLLCNQAKDAVYADEVHDDEIKYRVTSSTPSADVNALKKMAGQPSEVHVFEKLGVNKWRPHGKWCVQQFCQEGEGITFSLKRSDIATASLVSDLRVGANLR